MTDVTELTKHVKTLIQEAGQKADGTEAMKFAQAALNAAHAVTALAGIAQHTAHPADVWYKWAGTSMTGPLSDWESDIEVFFRDGRTEKARYIELKWLHFGYRDKSLTAGDIQKFSSPSAHDDIVAWRPLEIWTPSVVSIR